VLLWKVLVVSLVSRHCRLVLEDRLDAGHSLLRSLVCLVLGEARRVYGIDGSGVVIFVQVRNAVSTVFVVAGTLFFLRRSERLVQILETFFHTL
jgi:hypothetical protein